MFDSANTLSVRVRPGNLARLRQARLRHSSRGSQNLWLVCRRRPGQHRSTQRHQPGDDADRVDALRERLRRFSAEHPLWGYRLAWGAVRAEGWAVNRKKIQRLWREEGLRVPQRKRKRHGWRTPPPSPLP
jgi:hypothetical protein